MQKPTKQTNKQTQRQVKLDHKKFSVISIKNPKRGRQEQCIRLKPSAYKDNLENAPTAVDLQKNLKTAALDLEIC